MRQYEFKADRGFSQGLRPDSRIERGFLLKCKNVKPSQYGLEPFSPVTDPFTGHSPSFPWPQLVKDNNRILLFGETSVSNIDTSDFSTSSITTYDQEDVTSTKAIPAGTDWHIASFGSTWFAFNGSCVVFRSGLEQLYGLPEKTFVQDTVTMKTGCAHRGRFILGGFEGTDFWTRFTAELSAVSASEKDVSLSFTDIGKNYVAWSSVGGGDFPLWLFWPVGHTQAYSLAPTFEKLLDSIRGRSLGWMPMPFQGWVQKVAPLTEDDDRVIVYGEDGIVALTSENQLIPSTYGRRHLAFWGVSNRCSVGVTNGQHLIVDPNGDIWTLNLDLQLDRLGYREWIAPINDANLRIFFDPFESEWWLVGTDAQYILTQNGLFEHTQKVSSTGIFAEGLRGVAEPVTDFKLDVVTNNFETGAGRSTVTEVQADGTYEQVQARLHYRYDQKDSFWEGYPVILNPSGWASIRVNAETFRFQLTANDYRSQHINNLRASFQTDDRRFRRGASVDPVASGADSGALEGDS